MSEIIHIIPDRKTTFGDTCIHYKGISLRGEPGGDKPYEEQCCNAGVRYGDVMVNGEWKYHHARHTSGRPYSTGRCMPCHRAYNFGGAKCDKAEFPSEQEVDYFLKESDDRMKQIGVARKAIIEALNNRHGVGEMKCPVCNKGTLRYTRSLYNGHVHAKCTTDDCVGWME